MDGNLVEGWFLRLLTVCLLLVSTLGMGVGTVGAADPPIQISTDVTPEEPTIDESVRIETTISNIGGSENRNVDIRSVYLRQPGTANTYDRFSDVGTIGSGGSLSLPLATTFDSLGQKQIELRVTTSYSDDDSKIYTYTHPVFIDVTESDIQGDIQLTSVEVSDGSDVTIQGDASNIGSTDVQSVLLSVVDSENVTPTSPNGEYFVGRIDASEFATFDLTADIDSRTDSIPIEMTYIVDDKRVTKTQQVAVESQDRSAESAQAAASTSNSSTGLPIVPIGVVFVLLVVTVVGFVLWRRQ